MESQGGHNTYPECAHIPKTVLKEITEAARPLFVENFNTAVYIDQKHLLPASGTNVMFVDDFWETQALDLPRAKGENVLPLFERKVSDYKRIKLCSLKTNESLRCRWKSYVNKIEGLKRTPFKFPNNSDLHFYKCGVQFMPSLTPAHRESFRVQMALGPGVDTYGQIPIPCDMHVTKSVAKAKTKPVGSFKKAKKHSSYVLHSRAI